MIKTLIVSPVAMVSLNSFAADTTLQCKASYNLDTVLETTVTLGQAQSNKSFGEFEGFEFFLSDKGNGIIELQSLNSYEPSRSYATASVKEAGAYVELSIWTRDFILEIRCTK